MIKPPNICFFIYSIWRNGLENHMMSRIQHATDIQGAKNLLNDIGALTHVMNLTLIFTGVAFALFIATSGFAWVYFFYCVYHHYSFYSFFSRSEFFLLRLLSTCANAFLWVLEIAVILGIPTIVIWDSLLTYIFIPWIQTNYFLRDTSERCMNIANLIVQYLEMKIAPVWNEP